MLKPKTLEKEWSKGIKDNSDVSIVKLQNAILRKVGVDAGYWKAMRAKKTTLERIRGQDAAEYKLLWDYCETWKCKSWIKNVAKNVSYSEPPVFERMYFSIDSMIRGFLNGCRPLIGLDGCFLKTLHVGQLYYAIGRDGNDNLFPIALAIVPVENREMWSWFVASLLKDLGGVEENKWTFISDRQKGLLETLTELGSWLCS